MPNTLDPNRVRIMPHTKTIWHNGENGAYWSTQKRLKGFVVSGAYDFDTIHLTMKSAETERDLRNSMNKRFPFIMPRSKREIDKCKRLNLPVRLPYIKMETGKLIT